MSVLAYTAYTCGVFSVRCGGRDSSHCRRRLVNQEDFSPKHHKANPLRARGLSSSSMYPRTEHYYYLHPRVHRCIFMNNHHVFFTVYIFSDVLSMLVYMQVLRSLLSRKIIFVHSVQIAPHLKKNLYMRFQLYNAMKR